MEGIRLVEGRRPSVEGGGGGATMPLATSPLFTLDLNSLEDEPKNRTLELCNSLDDDSDRVSDERDDSMA